MEQLENGILEKIQKLLRLQQGAASIGSLAEAENAAMRVQELLLKYNLDLEDVTGHVVTDKTTIHRFDEHGIVNPKNEGKWIHHLYSTLCRFNFCKMIIINLRGLDSYACLVGTKENVEAVKALAIQVENKLRAAERSAWHNNISSEKRNAFRRGYFVGAVRGLGDKLREQREREEQANVKVTALVLKRDVKINEFINEQFGRLGMSRPTRVSARSGMGMGYKDGKNLNLNKEVGGNQRQLPK